MNKYTVRGGRWRRKVTDLESVLEDLRNGMRQVEVSKKYGVTRERVRQINDAYGLPKGTKVRNEAEKRNAAKKQAEREANRGVKRKAYSERMHTAMTERWIPICRFIDSNPSIPLKAMASRFGYTVASFYVKYYRVTKKLGIQRPMRGLKNVR
jgi:hypothetical protein